MALAQRAAVRYASGSMSANPNDPKVLDAIRRIPGAKRLRLQRSLIAMGHRLAESGIRNAHPEWDDERVRLELRDRIVRSREHYS